MTIPVTLREQWAQEFGRRTAEVAIAELRTDWAAIRLNEADGDEQEAAEAADARAWGILEKVSQRGPLNPDDRAMMREFSMTTPISSSAQVDRVLRILHQRRQAEALALAAAGDVLAFEDFAKTLERTGVGRALRQDADREAGYVGRERTT